MRSSSYVLIALCLHVCMAANCRFTANQDYYDGGSSTSATSAQDCCNQCAAAGPSACVVSVYYSGKCYLKTSNSRPYTNSGRESCSPQSCHYIPNQDYYDGGTETTATSQTDCCNQCTAKGSGCAASVYYGGKCYLKTSNSQPYVNSGRVSCVPTGPLPVSPWTHNQRFGASHWAGCYYLTTQPFLLDGAATVHKMGSRIVKFNFATTGMHSAYPFNSNWNGCCSTLVQLAQHTYWQQTFAMDFDTFVLVAYSGVSTNYCCYWVTGITSQQQQEETQQFYDLTVYLMQKYPNKTFVLQNWEGDWSLRNGDYNPDDYPPASANSNMIKWLSARQTGVTKGRAAAIQSFLDAGLGTPKGNVYLAAEVNLVADAMNKNAPDMILEVVPYVQLDLVSYSSYDTEGSTQFAHAIDYIAAHHNKTAASPSGAVVIGEYGVAQNQNSQSVLIYVTENVINSCLASSNCWYAMFWEIYDNEPKNGPHCDGFTTPVTDPNQLRGFWLVKPDGSLTWGYQYLQEIYSGAIKSDQP